MNDKLLRAFIEASGFDIEEVRTPKGQAFESLSYSPAGIKVTKVNGKWFAATIDYKVTKKNADIQGLIDIIDNTQSCLPSHTTVQWDNLQEVKRFLEGFVYEKD